MRCLHACLILALAAGCGGRPAGGMDASTPSDGGPHWNEGYFERDQRPGMFYRECPAGLSAGITCDASFAPCFHPGTWCEASSMGPTPSQSLYECQCSGGTVACQVVQPLDGQSCAELPTDTSCSYDTGRYPGGGLVPYRCTCAGARWTCSPLGPRKKDAGPDRDICGPLPSCNWCYGNEKLDAQGCVVGWTCANGVDPCQTPPCGGDGDCGGNETCGADLLCWPGGYPDAG